MRSQKLIPKQRRLPSTGPSTFRGIALVEVLVAMLIFMFGVLGLIGLQSSLTRVQTESKVRADAAYLASEVVGRMWGDMNNLAGYAGTDSCSASSCAEWRSKLATTLPNGTAAITVDAGSGDVSVTLGWTLPNGGAHKYVTQSTVTSKTAS